MEEKLGNLTRQNRNHQQDVVSERREREESLLEEERGSGRVKDSCSFLALTRVGCEDCCSRESFRCDPGDYFIGHLFRVSYWRTEAASKAVTVGD